MQYLTGAKSTTGKASKGPVRDSEPERDHDVRLRVLVSPRLTFRGIARAPGSLSPSGYARAHRQQHRLPPRPRRPGGRRSRLEQFSHGRREVFRTALVIIDRLRDVRLAAGVEENGRIDKEVAAPGARLPAASASVCATCRR